MNETKAKSLAIGAVVVLGSGLCLPLQAQLILNVGDLDNLLADTAGQERTLEVRNDGSTPVEVLGLQFNIQVADGEAATLSPTITGVDILAGTIFQDDNNGQTGGADTARRWEVEALANANPPNPAVSSGLSPVATITFDTTGFTAGAWDLSASTPAGGTVYLDPTTGNPLPISLIDGTISIVPEPHEYALVMSLGLLGIGVWRHRRISNR